MHLSVSSPGLCRRACGLLAGWRATPRAVVAVGGGPVPARGPWAGGRDGGRRLGSRRAGCTPGRCVPARRCVIPVPWAVAGMVPPPLRAAMLAAATRSRWPCVPAVRAAEVPPGGLRHPPGAGGAGGGGAPLVDQRDGDPGGLGLVRQGADEVAGAPVPGALVVPPARVQVQHAAGVADRERPDPVLHRPGHHGLGGLVLGLADPPPVPGLGRALMAAVLPPPPGSALPGSWGRGGRRRGSGPCGRAGAAGTRRGSPARTPAAAARPVRRRRRGG